CMVLKEFVRSKFAGLGWPKQRWDFTESLRNANCLVVRGPKTGGKSWLVKRSLRDAVYFGHQVKYVEVSASRSDSNFIDLLSAIVEADQSKPGSAIHAALDPQGFQDFFELRNELLDMQLNQRSELQIEQVCAACERGLKAAAQIQPLTIVFDHFTRDQPSSVSFAPEEFKVKLLT